MVWSFWMDFVCLLLYIMNAGLFTLCIFAPICFQVALHWCTLSVFSPQSLREWSRTELEWWARASSQESDPFPSTPLSAGQPLSGQSCPSGHFQPISRLITWLTGLSANQNHAYTAVLCLISYLSLWLSEVWLLCSSHFIRSEQPGHCRQSSIRAKAPLLHAWCDMNNWSQTLSFFNGMTKHTDWLSCRETFISWASETGLPSGTAC